MATLCSLVLPGCAGGDQPSTDERTPLAAAEPSLTGQTSLALVPAWEVFQDVTGTALDSAATSQRALGNRPISVSAYGTSAAPVFTAVFVERSGAAWRLLRGTGGASFSTTFSNQAAQNFKPVLLSFDGPADNPVWCAVFEQTASGIPFTRHSLISGSEDIDTTLQYWLKKAHAEKLIPSTISVYGGSDSPRYAAVFEDNVDNVAWAVTGLNETSAEYQERWNAQVPAGNRPAVVALNGDSRYLALFRDDSVGALVGRHALSAASLSTEIDTQDAAGRFPISIQGGGSGTARRFSALFAPTDLPLARSFRTRRSTLAADTDIATVDNVVRDFMARNGVRHAALAVLDNRRLAYARGYTFAESSYQTVTPTTHFRMASVSKTVTALEIMELVDRGLVALDTPVQQILNLRTPTGGLPPAAFGTITLRHLLTHRYPTLTVAGVDHCLLRDSAMGQNVADAFGGSLPVTALQSARFAMTASTLVTRPATAGCYSNFAYTLLGLVIESRRGMSYMSALTTDLFVPLGVTRARVAPNNAASRPSDEAFYRSATLSTADNVNIPGSPLCAGPYGADNFQALAAAGGVSMAATDMARLLALLNVTTSNPVYGSNTIIPAILSNPPVGFDQRRVDGNGTHYVKGGLLDGLQSTVYFTPGGMSYVLFWARNDVPNSGDVSDNWWPSWAALENALLAANLPSRANLFPSYGMPAL